MGKEKEKEDNNIVAKFNEAMFILAQHEGWKSNDPRDSGGETICGISARYYPDEVARMRNLPYEEAIVIAEKIFLRDYWMPINGDKIVSQAIAFKIFDHAVNASVKEGVKIAQRACNRLGGMLLVDGMLGIKTLAFLNMYRHYDVLAKVITHYREEFYFDLVDRKPDQKVFLDGWIRRA